MSSVLHNAPFQLKLLGTPMLTRGETILHLETTKALGLLCYLSIEQRPIRRDSLIDLFWPELNDSKGKTRLRRALWAIRSVVPDAIQVDRKSISFQQNGRLQVDTHRFSWFLQSDFTQTPDSRITELTAAVDLYRDAFMAGFSIEGAPDFDQWQSYNRQSWMLKAIKALGQLSSLHLLEENFDQAAAAAFRWLKIDPLDEEAHQKLIEIHAASGNQAAAVQQYERCVKILDIELGLPPAPETEALIQEILSRDQPKPTPSSKIIANNIPAQPTPFIGRLSELEEIQKLLLDPVIRFVTIVGAGGMGKTRLAMGVAEQFITNPTPDLVADGVYFVSLAATQDIEQLPAAVAQAVGLFLDTSNEKRQSSKDQVANFLREKHLLLIFDNFEHLLGGRVFLSDMMNAAPGVKILTTSREPLHLHGEHQFAIQGLAVSTREQAAQSDAFALFKAAAKRVQKRFEITVDNVSVINQICKRVIGMPLAIELAASWLNLLSPEEILVEMAGSLDFLSGRWENVAERHRSIRLLFDSSWDRLMKEDQAVLAQLALFRGGFTRTAATEVAGASLAILARLRSKSLLQYDPGKRRYSLHELLRQFAAEKLNGNRGAHKSATERYNLFYTRLASQWHTKLKGPRQLVTLDEIELEVENALVACRSLGSDQNQVEQIDLVFALGLFLFVARPV